jgi:hypothetical protein
MKILMYNISNGEILVTKAKIEGNVYQGYLKAGFKAIGRIDGFNVVACQLINKDKIILNNILK